MPRWARETSKSAAWMRRKQDVLDVLADVAGLGQRGGVGDAEGHVQDLGEGLGQQRLAGAGGPDEQDVRLLELDVVDLVAGVDPLVVVVHGHGENLLGLLLADDVLVQGELDGARVGQLGDLRLGARRLEHLLFDDFLAEVDALVADVDALARNQLANLLLALAAEAAAIWNLGAALGGRHAPGPVLCDCAAIRRSSSAWGGCWPPCGLVDSVGAVRRAGSARPADSRGGVDGIDDAILLRLRWGHEVVP